MQSLHLDTAYPPSGIPTNLTDNLVQRPVFLDGANVIMGMRMRTRKQEVASVSSVIALLRHLTSHGFQAYIVVQQKYTLSPLYGKVMFKILHEKGLLFTQPMHMYDDCAFFEMARVTGGVVVSQDNFRDHTDLYDLISTRAIRISFQHTKDHEKHKLTSDGQYIAFHTFKFAHPERFLAKPSDKDYSLVLDRRRSFPDKRQNELMTLFDKMLLNMRKHESFVGDGPRSELSTFFMQGVEEKNARFNNDGQQRQERKFKNLSARTL